MLIVEARWDMSHIHEHSDRHRKVWKCSLSSLWWDVTNRIMSPGIHVHCNTSTICGNKHSDSSNYMTLASQPGTIYKRSIPHIRQEFFNLIRCMNNEGLLCNHAHNYICSVQVLPWKLKNMKGRSHLINRDVLYLLWISWRLHSWEGWGARRKEWKRCPQYWHISSSFQHINWKITNSCMSTIYCLWHAYIRK